jgi:hypothetical protein
MTYCSCYYALESNYQVGLVTQDDFHSGQDSNKLVIIFKQNLVSIFQAVINTGQDECNVWQQPRGSYILCLSKQIQLNIT